MKHSKKPYTLQKKFLLSLGFAAAALCVVFSAIFFVHMQNVVEEQVKEKAELVFAQIDAIQGYVRETLRPRMFEKHPEAFLLEAMSSSYISRNIMDRMGDKAVGHVYRRVAIGARNPQSEANDLERSLIDNFRTDPTREKWSGTLKLRGTNYFVIARPVVFSAECMTCHGSLSDGPIEMKIAYGDRGFGHREGSIDGLDFVGFPVGSSEAQLKGVITSYFILFALCALFFFATAFFVFRVLVVRRLHGLAASFRRILHVEQVGILDRLEEKDEVEEVVERFEEVATHLADARAQLQSYADNLKQMVAERTAELSHEASERRADVGLFVQLFEDMRGTHTRERLWRGALPQICRRFGARRIAYVCTFASRRHYVWPETEILPELPEPLTPLLTESRVQVVGTRIFVPVEAQDGATEGLLCIEWDDPTVAARQNLDVLRALGRQLGTVAENITAFDRMMRQMDMLQAVFDGVGDPLALLDASGRLIIANEGARRLATELGTGDAPHDNLLLPLLASKIDEAMDAVLAGKTESHAITHKDGRSFQLHLYPLPQTDDKPGRIVAYVRETTAERRMLARISQSERMASVGRLSAGLAHEINNPLGVILCYAELLRQGATPGQLADLDVILRHTRQAQRVLRDLLNFARPKAYMGIPTSAAVTARRVAEVFSVQAMRKGATLEVVAADDLPDVGISEQGLEQIVTNLLLNSIDAIPETDGKIRITVEAAGEGRVALRVDDNGPGLDDEAQRRVFDPFYTTKDMGTGLGLAVVYGIAVDAGGTAEAKSSADLGGACFRVFLPVATLESVANGEGDN